MRCPRRIGLALLLSVASCGYADRLHFVIPAGPGGGLDGTAREIGRTLKAINQYEAVSYENMPGGGGGRALSQYLENRSRYQDAVLVNSTPLIVRSLQGLFPQSFRNLTPIAGLIADYGIFVVRADDSILSWDQLETAFKRDPSSIVVGGGSARARSRTRFHQRQRSRSTLFALRWWRKSYAGVIEWRGPGTLDGIG